MNCITITHQRRKTVQVVFRNSAICTATEQPFVVPCETLDTAVAYQHPVDVRLVGDVPYLNWRVWPVDQNDQTCTVGDEKKHKLVMYLPSYS